MKEENDKAKAELAHFTERKRQLTVWLETHDYNDPNFNQNLSDLRATECKLMQIESRSKKGHNGGINTVSMPIIQKHYSF